MRYVVMLLAFFLSFNAQASFVQGTITNESGSPLFGVSVQLKGAGNETKSDMNGFYSLEVQKSNVVLVYNLAGFETIEKIYTGQKIIDIVLVKIPEDEIEISLNVEITEETTSEEVVSIEFADQQTMDFDHKSISRYTKSPAMGNAGLGYNFAPQVEWNTEAYATIHENGFKKSLDEPLSTFSIDVDAASYSNVRRFLNMGQLPPMDAVRVEEMINYFTYDYAQPKGSDPFSINTGLAVAPWNEDHLIAQIGLQGEKIDLDELPPSNIVFLIDVSGSMSAQNKLPLLKSAFKMLVNELRPQDKISIVVYAAAAGIVLEPTDGNDKKTIMEALDRLSAGGSTAGGAGIELAYKTAGAQFVEGGNNRVILATDGDFNIGASSDASMERLIKEKRKEGLFLTVLGFGMGNYKDSKMEILANKGNGNYAYIDNMKEAKKVLVNEFGGTLFTIAKDVKIQVEFNPAVVQAYRLIGYENRKLNNEDFNDDKKDAGELGSGHTVTALYEIIPVGVESSFVKTIDPLKYQNRKDQEMINAGTGEILTVKFRYKKPDGDKSKLITKVVKNEVLEANENLKWSMAVAGFGMLLRESEFSQSFTYNDVITLAKSAKGTDVFGYRGEFIELVGLASKVAISAN